MSKKKKKIKKLAESNIQMLKSGKIKIAKDQKINISSFVSKSVENTIVSRLDAIISKEDVVIDTKDLHPNITTNLTNPVRTAELTAQINNPVTETIVITMSKKQSLEAFNYLDDGSLGEILRTSTLAAIYKQIKDAWISLTKDDTSHFTNVLYIPDVMVFLDTDKMKIRKNPYKINVLLIAEPSVNKMTENGIEKLSDEAAASRVIADITEAAIKCGCKNIIIDPFGHKTLSKDISEVSKLWMQITSSQRFIENITSTIFAIEQEERFVVFNASKLGFNDPSVTVINF